MFAVNSKQHRAGRMAIAVAVLAVLGGMLTACELPADTALGGDVTANNGGPLGQVTVQVYANSAETLLLQTTTDANGRYLFDNTALSPGTYRVAFTTWDAPQWYSVGATSWATATPVVVPGDEPTRVDAVFSLSSSFTGVVTDPIGFPLSDTYVLARDKSTGLIVGLDGPTDSTGQFDVGVPTGVSVTLTFQSDVGATLGGSDPVPFENAYPATSQDLGEVAIAEPISVSSSTDTTCWVLTNGSVWCVGANDQGQLGNGTTTDSNTPVQAIGIDNATQVSVGTTHVCARLASNGAKCWGRNVSEELGTIDSGGFQTTPQTVELLIPGIAQISAGSSYTCALTVEGSVWCWGDNAHGELGDGTTATSDVGVEPITSGAVQVAAGSDHTCAVMESGKVDCWGANDHGQIGDGTTIDRLVPVNASVSAVRQVALGSAHSCASTSTGVLWCWGSNTWGQIGDGTTIDRALPVPVSGFSNAVEVSAGAGHSCARTASKMVLCWGFNGYANLGDGTTTDSLTPVAVPGLSDAMSLDAGRNFVCVTRATGAAICWGRNHKGQLGIGSTGGQASTPSAVVGIPNAYQVPSGV